MNGGGYEVRWVQAPGLVFGLILGLALGLVGGLINDAHAAEQRRI
jgi:hypothetical protein